MSSKELYSEWKYLVDGINAGFIREDAADQVQDDLVETYAKEKNIDLDDETNERYDDLYSDVFEDIVTEYGEYEYIEENVNSEDYDELM